MHRGTKQGRGGVAGFEYGLKPKEAPCATERAPVARKEAPSDGPVTAVVTSLYLKQNWSPKLVSVLVDGNQQRCRIREGARDLFAPGMEIHVRAVAAGVWESQDVPRRRSM